MHMKVWHKTAQCFFSIETHQSVKRWKYHAPRKGFIGVLSDIVPIGASSGLSGCQQRAVCSCFGFGPGTLERRIFQVQHIKMIIGVFAVHVNKYIYIDLPTVHGTFGTLRNTVHSQN